MAYYFESGIWSSVFAVPSAIVDRHIKLCSPLSLKVLMVLLRSGSGSMEPERLAELLGQSRADIQDALNYWIENGVIHKETNEVVKSPTESGELHQLSLLADPPPTLSYTVVKSKDAGEHLREDMQADSGIHQERVVTAITHARPRLTTQEINEMAEQDNAIGNLLQETQQIMGKPLTPMATDLVVALYSYYGMQPDLVLMLIQYCVSIGKDSVRYMEKVASSWMEQGIDSHEKAETEILRATQKNQMENRIKAAFGIYDRTLVASEKKYVSTWVNEYRMELPLIQLAFERSVEMKGKLSFAYINGILSNWHQKKITTTAEAMGEITRGESHSGGVHGDFAGGKASSGQLTGNRRGQRDGGKASYDMNALEVIISHGDLKK